MRAGMQSLVRPSMASPSYLDSFRKLSLRRDGTQPDCSRIFGPSIEHSVLRATMENARGDANRWFGTALDGQPLIGVSPRRSDRCAILRAAALLKSVAMLCGPRCYAATRVSAINGRSSRHTRQTMRARRLVIAAVAMFAPRRAAMLRIQIRNGVAFAGFRQCESRARAPCIKRALSG